MGLNEIPTVKILNEKGNYADNCKRNHKCSIWITFFQTGENGHSGIGGLGGLHAEDSFREIGRVRCGLDEHTVVIKKKIASDTVYPDGSAGAIVTNCNGLKEPVSVVSFHSSPSITAYQEYARENLANTMWRSNLEHFVNGLTNNKKLDSFFDVSDLIEEFNSLEKQFFHLHRIIDFLPFYQSLKNRIDRNIKRIGKSNDERKLAKLLYTAVASKLPAIRKETNQIAVTNILTYLDTITKNIEKLNDDKKIEHIIELRDNYKRSLDEKIKSASDMVQNMVIATIDKTFDEMERNIQKLLDEAVDNHEETEEAHRIAEDKRKQLKKAMVLPSILAPIKLLGILLELVCPQGAAVGTGNLMLLYYDDLFFFYFQLHQVVQHLQNRSCKVIFNRKKYRLP